MRSSESKPCRTTTLATGPFASVERCQDCGTLSVHLGAVSMRLDRGAAESLWTTLGQALSSLPRQADDAQSRFARA